MSTRLVAALLDPPLERARGILVRPNVGAESPLAADSTPFAALGAPRWTTLSFVLSDDSVSPNPARKSSASRSQRRDSAPRTTIAVQGARVHNLKNVSRRDPARQADRRHRPLRVRQVEPRVRHDLRRGAAALHGVALELREAVRRAGREARRRLRVRPLAGDLDRAEDDRRAIRARPSAR